MMRLLSEYRVHLVGLLCFAWLGHAWRAGDLTELSFTILAITAGIELGIWLFLMGRFREFEDDPVRQQRDADRAELWTKSAHQKGGSIKPRRAA